MKLCNSLLLEVVRAEWFGSFKIEMAETLKDR